MNRIGLVLVALAFACGTAPEAASAAVAHTAPVLALPLELADAGSQAAMLWAEAGYAVPRVTIADAAPGGIEVRVVHGLIEGCGVDFAWGCTQPAFMAAEVTIVSISDATPPGFVVSVLTHEIGHALGLQHTDNGDIMDPNRDFAPVCVEEACL